MALQLGSIEAAEQAGQVDHFAVRRADRRGKNVPENWDPAYYRERAKAWREKAILLSEDDPEREVCVELAAGYDKLATLLEQRRWQPVQ
jgi:hypothetical protein